MKILLLLTYITWSFGSGIASDKPASVQIVQSPEEAAIIVWNDRPLPFMVEPDRKAYRLVEVDLQSNAITDICIPRLEFKTEP